MLSVNFIVTTKHYSRHGVPENPKFVTHSYIVSFIEPTWNKTQEEKDDRDGEDCIMYAVFCLEKDDHDDEDVKYAAFGFKSLTILALSHVSTTICSGVWDHLRTTRVSCD